MRVRCHQCGLDAPDERIFRRYYPSVSAPAQHFCPACWRRREDSARRLEIGAVLGMLGVIALGAAVAPEDMGGGIGRLALTVIGVYGASVLLHELGHALAAWAMGMHVFLFSVGMGPEVLARRWGRTKVELRAVPVCGMVMPGVRSTRWARLKDFIVTACGPGVNIALAVTAYAMLGGQPVWQATRPGDIGLWPVVFAINAMIAALNLIPFSTGGGRDVDDGAPQPNDGMLMLLSITAGRRMVTVWIAAGLRYEVDDLIERGRGDEALAAAEQCVDRFPDVPILRLIHARTLAEMGHRDRAESTLRDLLEDARAEPWVHALACAHLGTLLLESDDAESLPEADRLTTRAAELAPTHPEIRIARARAQLARGWVAEASRALTAMLGEGHDEPTLARCACAMVEASLAEGDGPEAQRYLNLAERLHGKSPALRRARAAMEGDGGAHRLSD